MTDMRKLIERARELAALAQTAVPGPWECRQVGLDGRLCDVVLPTEVHWKPVALQVDARTGPLIAAAPEMAELLKQMADALEGSK